MLTFCKLLNSNKFAKAFTLTYSNIFRKLQKAFEFSDLTSTCRMTLITHFPSNVKKIRGRHLPALKMYEFGAPSLNIEGAVFG